MRKGVVQILMEDGEYEKIEIAVDEEGKITGESGAAAKGGPNLGCLLGIHAWKNGVCVVCGKRG